MSLLGLVLAGRRNEGRLRDAAPEAAWEALIPVAGRPIAGWVVAALQGAGCSRVVVVGPDGVAGDVVSVPPGLTLTENLRRGVAALQPGPDDELLVAAGDAPLMSAEGLAATVAACRSMGAPVGYPVVRRKACDQAFPGVHRTYVRLRDGSFTGGNAAYMVVGGGRGGRGATALPPPLHAARKQPWRLAAMFGLGAIFALLTGRARIKGLEAVAAKRFGLAARAVVSADAGIGVDVDKPGDLDLCRSVLGQQRS